MPRTFKTVLTQVAAISILAGCGTTVMPVQSTGVDGEYVVSASNQDGPFSSLEKAQNAAIERAMDTCAAKGLKYKRKYTTDRPLRIGQVPESVLHFTCEK